MTPQRKRTLSCGLLALLLTLCLLAGCGGETQPPEEEPPKETGESLPPETETPQKEEMPAEAPEPAEALPPEEEMPPSGPEPGALAQLLDTMSLREKLCQLIVAYPHSLTGHYPVTEADAALTAGLAEWPVAGLFFDGSNVKDREQVKALLAAAQEAAPLPLLLTCDEEGGRVSRLSGVGVVKLGAMFGYRDEGSETAWENARSIAEGMAELGFNLDLAPVADVWSNSANRVIGDRAYSDDFAAAAELVAAAVEGFHAGGVACTLKHFPGHGDTEGDTHTGAVSVQKDLEQLRTGELLPFSAGIEAGADMVMLGHLTVTALDEVPAPLSHAVVTKLLRQELGFDGVVMTDALTMSALADHYPEREAVVRIVQAGADLLLCPADLPAAVEALESAVQDGTLTEARIDESVLRVLRLKDTLGLLTAP